MKWRSAEPYLATVLVAGAALIFIYPLVWMMLASFKSNPEIFNTRGFWPRTWTTEYYATLVSNDYFPFAKSLMNSIGISLAQGIGATILAAMAGYALGLNRFRGRAALLIAGLLVILIPAQTIALPLFMWVNTLGLFDNPVGVILPGLVSGLGLLFMTRVYGQMPRDLIDMARLEGASEFRIFLITLPLAKPFLIAFGFAHFTLSWHAHIVPMLVLNSEAARTLPISLAALYGSSLNAPQAVLMAGSVVGMLPLIVIFAAVFPRLKTALQDFVAY